MSDAAAIPEAPTELSPTPATVQADAQGQSKGEQSTVQPGQGQGRQDEGSGLYDLSSIADPATRREVEKHLKEIERNTNGRFQEHAEYRKAWEPYEQLGINSLDPEGLEALLSFATRLSDPEDAQAAIFELAEELGLDLGQPADAGLEYEAADEDYPDDVREALDWVRQQQEREVEQQIREEETARLNAEWEDVTRKHGKPIEGDLADRVRRLAGKFLLDSTIERPIEAAYDFITEVGGAAAQQLVNDTPVPPARAEGAGSASTAVKPPDTFEEAERLMRERRRSLTT